jgi:predicted MPP superfamily phosphohydrolase
MNRRHFLKTFGQMMATYTVAGFGLHQEDDRPMEAASVIVEQVQIPLKNLPSALEGFRTVQLSDIHIDSYRQIEVVQEAMTLVNSLQPDVIVLTGDYVSRKAEAISELAPMVASLNAKYGVFAILGNHDIWTNPVLIRDCLEKAGLPVLVNEGVPLKVGKDVIYLAGLDDCWSGQADLNATLNQLPTGALTILLAHEPDFADTFALDGRISLQLSGHTHGGQIRLPGHKAIILPPHGKKYDQGLYNVDGMWLYTNRGVGLWPVPYRVNCPPEVTEITLIGAQ